MGRANKEQELLYSGERAVLATMHAKEQVIAPLAQCFLGLRVKAVAGLDTDAFGTFTRITLRTGSPLDAARAKIAAAFILRPDVQIGLASEGSFGPHPAIPFCPLGRELLLLVDRQGGFELVGHAATIETNFGHRVVSDVATGLEFARASGFPEHGMIVMGSRANQPAPDLALFKDATEWADLASALEAVIARHGTAHIETDMRAHRNPRRMRWVKRAMIDLIRRSRSTCPSCNAPGYGVTDRLMGLPCAWCSEPTMLSRADVLSCGRCGHREERPVAEANADPAHCGDCNP